MKVALVVAGHFKHFESCYKGIKKFLVERYDADVFIHTYDTVSYSYDNNIKNKNNQITRKDFDSLAPKKIVIENSDNILNLLQSKINHAKTLFKLVDNNTIQNQITSIRKRKVALELVDSSYDFIILIRPDTLILKPVELNFEKLNIITLKSLYQDSFIAGPSVIIKHFIHNIDKRFGLTTEGINLITCPHRVIESNSKKYDINLIDNAWVTLLPKDTDSIKNRETEFLEYYKNSI